MTTFSAISCSENHGTRSEGQNKTGGTSSVELRCAWSDRAALVNDILVNRRADPENPNFRASSASVVPEPASYAQLGQTIVYGDALVTINYSSAENEDLISESLEPHVEFQILDYREFRWASGTGDPLKEGEAPGRLLNSLNLKRTLFRVDVVPPSLLTVVGKVNDTQYVSQLLGLTFDAETLLMGQPQIDRTIGTVEGSSGFTVDLTFNFKPEGWNKYWRSETQSFEEIFLSGGASAYKSYPLGSFADFLA